VIAAACRDSECLRFGYRSRDGTDSRREVEPHSVVNLGRRWYSSPGIAAAKTGGPSRVDRLSKPASTGVRFTGRRLPAKDAVAYVEQSITGAPTRFEAILTLHGGAEEISGRSPRTGHDRADKTRTPAGTGRATTISDGWHSESRCSASTSMCTSRPELVDHLRALASRIRRATR